jgi:hypothetical protein
MSRGRTRTHGFGPTDSLCRIWLYGVKSGGGAAAGAAGDAFGAVLARHRLNDPASGSSLK